MRNCPMLNLAAAIVNDSRTGGNSPPSLATDNPASSRSSPWSDRRWSYNSCNSPESATCESDQTAKLSGVDGTAIKKRLISPCQIQAQIFKFKGIFIVSPFKFNIGRRVPHL